MSRILIYDEKSADYPLIDQTTITQEYKDAPWTSKRDEGMRKFAVDKNVHYRLVLNKVGLPLESFENASELFNVGNDVLDGSCHNLFLCITLT